MLRPAFAFERRLPAWLRPACRGAMWVLVLGGGVAGKIYALVVLASLILLIGPVAGAVLFVALIGLAMVAGAVAGAVHGILEPLDYWGRLGSWLRWFPAILAACATAVMLTPHGPISLSDTQLYLFVGVLAAMGAALLTLVDDRRPGRLTPREFEWVQANAHRRAAADQDRVPGAPDSGQVAPRETEALADAPSLSRRFPSRRPAAAR